MTDLLPSLSACTTAKLPAFGEAIALSQFAQSRFKRFLTYPQTEAPAELSQRLTWLQNQGITGIYNYGSQHKDGWNLLGLGYCGAVLLADRQGQPVALKLQRMDSNQGSFESEAEALAIANSLAIGPQLITHCPQALIMNYCPGPGLMQWLEQEQPRPEIVWQVLQPLLEQACALDQAGLDHGDLRCVTEHVRVWTNQATLIDFSSASQIRRPANVTTLTQGIFIGTAIAAVLKRQYPDSNLACKGERRTQLIEHLRHYKFTPGKKAHGALLNFLKP